MTAKLEPATGRSRAIGVVGALILCVGAASAAELGASGEAPAVTVCGAVFGCSADAPVVSMPRLLWGNAVPSAGISALPSLLASGSALATRSAEPSRSLRPGAGDPDSHRYDVLVLRPTEHSPVSARHDSRDNLYVDMSYWRTTSTSLRMVYGHRAVSGVPAASAEPGKEQVGIDFDLDLGSATFHASSGRVVGAGMGGGAGAAAEDDGPTLVQYGLSGGEGKLRYGAQYANAGGEYKDYLSLSDTPFARNLETTTLWTQLALMRRLSLRAQTEQRRKHPEGEAARPRYVDELAGLKLNLVLNSWPYVGTSVWYRQGLRDTAGVPGRGENVARSGASVSLRTGWGTQSLTRSLSTVGGDRLAAPANEQLSQSLNLKFHPGRRLSLGAAFSVGESSKYGEGGLWAASYSSESVWATLDPQDRNYSLTWSGNQNGYTTYEGAAGYASAYTKLTLAFDSVSLFEVRIPLKVNLRFSSYVNDVYPNASTSDAAVWVRFGRSSPGPSVLDAGRFGYTAFDLTR